MPGVLEGVEGPSCPITGSRTCSATGDFWVLVTWATMQAGGRCDARTRCSRHALDPPGAHLAAVWGGGVFIRQLLPYPSASGAHSVRESRVV